MITTSENLTSIRADNLDDTIVLTSGTFDLFHVGHLRYLEAVKTYGHIMVVMLSGDARVKHRKGTGRPIIPQAERVQILDALRIVDYVFIDDGFVKPGQTDPRYAKMLADLRPQVYATDGEDIRFSQLTGHDTEIVIVPRADGGEYGSTSAIIEHIRHV